MTTIERGADGSTTEYFEVPVAGDHVERLMREVFEEHWAHVSAGPIIEGSAWEIRFTSRPKLSMLDGYLTVDPGSWHFHLCVNDHQAAPSPELARVRRVARAAFFRTEGGSCVPGSWESAPFGRQCREFDTLRVLSKYRSSTEAALLSAAPPRARRAPAGAAPTR